MCAALGNIGAKGNDMLAIYFVAVCLRVEFVLCVVKANFVWQTLLV